MSQMSPMMAQYLETKKKFPDCILFYRIGDFYEMFFDDAKIGSEELDLVLTGKDCGLEERAPMCGVPFHAADNYITKLVKKGYKVAIGEQVEDPRYAKGIVKRSVTRVVTPGTLTEAEGLSEERNNYLMAVYFAHPIGISLIDISTGEFSASEAGSLRELCDEESAALPAEIICGGTFSDADIAMLTASQEGVSISTDKLSLFRPSDCKKLIEEHFSADSETLGFSEMPSALTAAGAALSYVYETQFSQVPYITQIRPYRISDCMILDSAAVRNLELVRSLREGEKKGSLLWILDKTKTAMGSRFMRSMILKPLSDKKEIEKRLDAIAELGDRFIDREEMSEYLKPIYDLERLLARASSGRALPQDMTALRQSLGMVPHLKNVLRTFESPLLRELSELLDPISELRELLESAIDEDAPQSVREGRIIRDGYDAEVDRLRNAKLEGKKWLLELEARERESTGIRNLRVKFNRNFGHCIEVGNSFKDQVPARYIRKQTLTTGERYTTEELEQISSDLNGADERLVSLEYDIFKDILSKTAARAQRIQQLSSAIAYLDAMISLSLTASRNHYCRPSINEKGVIKIHDGRHPVVELMQEKHAFVPNDTYLNTSTDRTIVITGPNMAGKSTYMRQTALICLMAQMGSFVPAQAADICISDRIFTRVGASDDLAGGRSTFMVEMTELASILRHATSKSLIILDEIGRGTSTYDGLAIAWAVVEYLSDKKKIGAKTLFATHYHELTELEGRIKGVKCCCSLVKEYNGELVFSRKIVPGGADKSYGIQVARLAGVPSEVLVRAEKIAQALEESDINSDESTKLAERIKTMPDEGSPEEIVAGEYRAFREAASRIRELDIDRLTPMEALFFLNDLKEKLDK